MTLSTIFYLSMGIVPTRHREEGDLLVFNRKYRCRENQPPACKGLHAHVIYDSLRAIIDSLDRETHALVAKKESKKNTEMTCESRGHICISMMIKDVYVSVKCQ
jgi:hypothetical protein